MPQNVMVTYVTYFLLSCCEVLLAFPVAPSRSNNAVSNESQRNLTAFVEVSHMGHSGLCIQPTKKLNSFETGCNSSIVFEFQKNRIPQLLPHVNCISNFPIVGNVKRSVCEVAKYLLPVLYRTNREDDSILYKAEWESVTVACVRSMVSSLAISSSEYLTAEEYQ